MVYSDLMGTFPTLRSALWREIWDTWFGPLTARQCKSWSSPIILYCGSTQSLKCNENGDFPKYTLTKRSADYNRIYFPLRNISREQPGNLSRLRYTWKAADRQNILSTAWLKVKTVVEFNVCKCYNFIKMVYYCASYGCNRERERERFNLDRERDMWVGHGESMRVGHIWLPQNIWIFGTPSHPCEHLVLISNLY